MAAEAARGQNFLLGDRHHVRDLAEHAPNLGGVLQLAGAVHLVEAEADKRCALILLATDRRTRLGHLHRLAGSFLLLRHLSYSAIASASAWAVCEPPRPSRSAIFLPRRWATALGEVCEVSASKVARIMLYGFDVTTDLVATSATPRLSNTARIGPPAMMPV